MITNYIFVADQAAAFHKILYLYYAIYNYILVNMPNIFFLLMCTFRGYVQMITDYIGEGGGGSTETTKGDYVIYGWPLIVIHF